MSSFALLQKPLSETKKENAELKARVADPAPEDPDNVEAKEKSAAA